jgi:hypothetical protein
VKQITSSNFGLLIAILLPGFVALWGASYFSPTVRLWLGPLPTEQPTVAGFLYVTIGAVGAGMSVSAIRWLTIDTIHHYTGIRQPNWDYSKFQSNIVAYEMLNQFHYRYYQCHSNLLVAIVFSYVARIVSVDDWAFGWLDIGLLALAVVFFVTSRDNLEKYYTRVAKLLGTENQKRRKKSRRSGN